MCFAHVNPLSRTFPCISVHFSGVDQHCPFALWDRFGFESECSIRGFALIILILHFFAQSSSLLMLAWNFIEDIARSSCVAKFASVFRKGVISS
jgi:hypothetical protein